MGIPGAMGGAELLTFEKAKIKCLFKLENLQKLLKNQ